MLRVLMVCVAMLFALGSCGKDKAKTDKRDLCEKIADKRIGCFKGKLKAMFKKNKPTQLKMCRKVLEIRPERKPKYRACLAVKDCTKFLKCMVDTNK